MALLKSLSSFTAIDSFGLLSAYRSSAIDLTESICEISSARYLHHNPETPPKVAVYHVHSNICEMLKEVSGSRKQLRVLTARDKLIVSNTGKKCHRVK